MRRFFAALPGLVALAVLAAAYPSLARASEYTEPLRHVPNVEVRSSGKVVFSGTVDLGPTLDRIARGETYPHRNDGAVFGNRERRLPKKPSGWYREYVHPTPGVRGPGPQRIVLGKDGDAFYTPDHYETFHPLNERTR